MDLNDSLGLTQGTSLAEDLKDMEQDEIKRAVTPPLLPLDELVKPDKWVNIPSCLNKGFEHVIENASHQEKMILTLNRKIVSMQKQLDKSGIESRKMVLGEVDKGLKESLKTTSSLADRVKT